MKKERIQNLIDALEACDYEWEAYSGRSMYGKKCVAIKLGSTDELYKLGRDVGDACPRTPIIDNMGKGYIAYWPTALLNDETQEIPE